MPTIRELRESQYLSRRALAELADVSESAIVRMEEGPGHTTQEIVEKVLVALSKHSRKKVLLSEIEGLNLYNIMRDRKPRPKMRAAAKESE